MAEQQERQPISEEERANWVREQFQKANKFLAENGVLFDTVITEESRYLIPYLAVWKIKAMDGKLYWVISGDLPSDYTTAENAKDAKEVLRHFAMHWQLKAENLINAKNADESQKEFGALLINRAENLFAMQNTPELWA
ncbi:DUF4826 family protein [Alteromonas portus]|uniref:DUF4826 family protein n=1 Tax=Alteromonas portus TaxID=2565549 RepID=UPI003BF84DF5